MLSAHFDELNAVEGGIHLLTVPEVVAKGRITLLVVILAKAGIRFSPHFPDFNGVEKGLTP